MTRDVPRAGETNLTLSDFRGAAGRDRRREPRTPCNKQIKVMPFHQALCSKYVPVELLDCSPHGLCILAEEPMVVGHLFLAKLKLEKLVVVAYTVQSCTRVDCGFRIGAALSGFVMTPEEYDADRIFQALLDASA